MIFQKFIWIFLYSVTTIWYTMIFWIEQLLHETISRIRRLMKMIMLSRGCQGWGWRCPLQNSHNWKVQVHLVPIWMGLKKSWPVRKETNEEEDSEGTEEEDHDNAEDGRRYSKNNYQWTEYEDWRVKYRRGCFNLLYIKIFF